MKSIPSLLCVLASLLFVVPVHGEFVASIPRGHHRYRGIYFGSGQEYRLEAYLDVFGRNVQLEMKICVGGAPQRTRVMFLASDDPKNSTAYFTVRDSQTEADLELKYSANWKSLKGEFYEGDAPEGGRPRFELNASDYQGPDCIAEVSPEK